MIHAQGVAIDLEDIRFRVGFRSNVEYRRARDFPAKEAGFVSALLEAARSAEVFFDVGANVGLFSLSVVHVHDRLRAFAFEPEPLNYSRLLENVRMNNFEDRITPVQIALGDRRGKVLLKRKGNQAGHGGHAVVAGKARQTEETESVSCETMDSLVAEGRLPPPDLVKIDVEGFELQVLRGMRQLLDRHQPLVFLELHPRRLFRFGGSREAFQHFLDAASYRSRPIQTKIGNGEEVSHRQNHLVLHPRQG